MSPGVGIGAEINPVIAVAPIAADAVQTSAAIDTLGYLSATLLVLNGAATGTPSSYTVNAKIQDCDTSDGQFEDVSGLTTPQLTSNGTKAEKDFGIASVKRYIKVLVTPALSGGSSPKALIAATVVLGDHFSKPV